MLSITDSFLLKEKNFIFEFSGELQNTLFPANIKIGFEASLKNNGKIFGKLLLLSEDPISTNDFINIFQQELELEGIDKTTKMQIILKDCNIQTCNNKSDYSIECHFLLSEIILQNENFKKLSLSNISLHFGLSNVFKINRYAPPFSIIFKRNNREIQTTKLDGLEFSIFLGMTKFYNYVGIEEKERLMTQYGQSLITSSISILVSQNQLDLEELEKTSINSVDNVIAINSFIQGCRQDWNFFLIEKDNKIIYIKILKKRQSFPFNFPLNNGIVNFDYSNLLASFEKSEYKENISLALDWYLDSLSSEEIEFKFLTMSTALECILEPYHKKNNTENILTNNDFDILKKNILPQIYAILKLGENDKQEREKKNTLDSSFTNLKRLSYAKKIILILKQLNINYDYVKLNPNQIVRIRNDIVHRGKIGLEYNKENLNLIYKQYKALWSVTIRIFLKLLNYSGKYFDPYESKLEYI